MAEAVREPTETDLPPGFHLVALGASAGGLEALEKFFQNVPTAPTGIAYVVIQHLSPEHRSMMDSLLARHTALPIVMAEDGMPLRPDRVHLIPPGFLMQVAAHRLQLTPKSTKGLTLPIDVFFSSAAEDFGPNLIGVVLSGTGSDGTRGSGAINEAGGFLLAQSPEEAKFDGMPRSAINTGLIDLVMPVAEMPARILAHVRSDMPVVPMPESIKPGALDVATGPEQALSGILHLLLQMGGINFEDYKPATVLRRLERRMVVRQVVDMQAYLRLLQDDNIELATLRRELLIPVTSFFRDAASFEALQAQVIEPLVMERSNDDTLRVWCAATSTGEEAYSVAMLFLQTFDRLKRWPKLKVFATDVEPLNIDAAAAGHYPESVMTEVPQVLLDRFFEHRGASFVVKPELRQSVVFARHNLLADPPFTRLDLVVCRNVLIYFKTAAQLRVLRRFQYALNARGYLFLGPSESLGGCDAEFETMNSKAKIWRKLRAGPLRHEVGSGFPLSATVPDRRAVRAPPIARPAAPPLDALCTQALLSAYAPAAAILVNAQQELVHTVGDVRAFIRMQPGEASLSLSRLLPRRLAQTVAALLFKVARDARPVRSEQITLDDDAAPIRLHLHARPAGTHEGQPLVLIAFEVDDASSAPSPDESLDVPIETAERLQALERELVATRESLQATIEELETSNEELQATNEEMVSSNEELQSTNEELQSVNEELSTVNAEYQEKVEVLNQLNADLDSLARVVAAGTVFVDDQLNVTRFSPEAAELFRFRSSDVGRPISDLNHSLDFPRFFETLRTALDTERIQECDVQGLNRRRYLVRMLPYRVASTGQRGVAVSFLDITAVHQATRLQSILDALAEHVAVLDSHGIIQMVNRAWIQFADANGDPGAARSGPGTNYLRCCRTDGMHDAATASDAEQGLRSVLEGRAEAFSLEYPCDSPSEARWYVMHVRPLKLPDLDLAPTQAPRVQGAVVSHVDITVWRARLAGAETVALSS